MSSRIYLTLDDVLWIHEEQIREYGGAAGVRDAGLIESALLRPQTGYYSDLVEEASALWESLAMNHGFIDGNKRVGFACTIIFLAANGLEPTGSEQEWIDFIYSNLEAGTFRKDILEAWLREHSAPLKT
ncbi:type II toxin-antitoxin system death-on-curing family toxin [Devosia sp. 63-57]|uniref:type II toxin-antitoxin system death-on-curing family toxin n=1 Tax=Devosia sp. 63-57 TaxID=1895751 RepID=UPI00086A1013|nr:type II toxin-antitoxin system death-on-curing family toxin [Devosia sp. 63-57]ODT47323.1 MAG: death-on-curing protein [Pelagibacterium sp. SCN 63-126]ODU87000.1 MAG: death-on-curing protein [Pelagibacterium sp. SCN 63-17]OJX42969.1 MAG: death-on-curing protein [Devosia sp. 63-57]